MRGQYEGYLDVDGVDPNSTTETFVAVRLAVDSWRWAGVPIVIRAGKTLPVTATEVTVRFHHRPATCSGSTRSPQRAAIPDLAGDRGGLTLAGKKPGAGWEPQTEELAFAQRPGADMRPYDRLIGAALAGDRWLFARQDTVEAAWRVVDPILGDVVPVHPYARGTWGPQRPTGCSPTGTTWHNPQ